MKNAIIILLVLVSLGLSGFAILKKSPNAQTEEYVLVRFQARQNMNIIGVYYSDHVVDKSVKFEMNKFLQEPNLDKVVIVLEELNGEGFTLVSSSTSNSAGSFNGIYFVMKRTKVN